MRRRPCVPLLIAALIASWPAPAPALAPPAKCPKKVDAAPPAEALELKNVAQDMRSAEAWTKATRYFRDAVVALPRCPTYADERLRWTLWAVETFEASRAAPDDDLRGFVDAQLDLLAPDTDRLPDHPQLVAARERLQPVAEPEPQPVPEDIPPPPVRRSRPAGPALLGTGGAVLVVGAVLGGVFASRARGLSDQLNGDAGLYDQAAAVGCGAEPTAGDDPSCTDLRADIDHTRDAGHSADTVAVVGISLAAVGAALALTGLGLTLHARRARRSESTLRVVPQWAGLSLTGRF
ncbi:MAG: hypothetical protein JNL82_25870 [Myxococcales bacterium]|nr:hypothetical protein [Myxococcales bacterium]